MAELFLSYAHQDVGRAETLAQLLEAGGLTVWWDRRMGAGDKFDDVIEEELGKAKAVIVLWSRISVKSDYVRGEAQTAHELGKLIPIKIEKCDLQIHYRAIHTPEVYKSKSELQKLAKILTDKYKLAQPGQPTKKIEFSDKAASNFFAKLGKKQAQYEKESAELDKTHDETLASTFRLIRKNPIGATMSIGSGVLLPLAAISWGIHSGSGATWPAAVGLGFVTIALFVVVFILYQLLTRPQSLWQAPSPGGKTTTAVFSVAIPCPHCGTVNRVPRERQGDETARCGKCHQSLFPAHA